MREYTIQQWLLFKSAGVVLIGISLAMIYFILYLIKSYDLHSLVTLDDVIIYNGKVIACISSTPLFIYTLFFSLRTILRKEIKPINNKTLTGSVWGAFSIASFIFGLFLSLLIPTGLKALNYTSCHADKLRVYYVINRDLCNKIPLHHTRNRSHK